jgi:ABC-2 type transport system ATP-binding protein
MIEVSNLTKRYGPVTAIKDITFSVQKGEVLGFLGPNGAGKTTTMRVLTCFHPATSGTARVAGYDVFKQPLEVRKRIGYVPENVPLYGEMSVESYLSFTAEVKGVDRSKKAERIGAVMDACALESVKTRLIGRLSKGYRQRVGLAQALIHEPEVLVLDEPTEGLDPKQIIEVRELIKGMRGKRTVILSSHILPEVSQTCQRVVIINNGRIVATDSPERLQARVRGTHELQVTVRAAADSVAALLRGIPGVVDAKMKSTGDGASTWIVTSDLNHDVREAVSAGVVGKGWGLLELAPVGMSLEQIFLELTTKEPEVAGREVTT